MAVKNLYLLPGAIAAGTKLMRDVQDGGSAPSALTSATGWTVGKTATSTPYALMIGGTKRAANTFGATAMPSVAPVDQTTGDSFRAGPYLGTFAATSWSIGAAAIAVSNTASGAGRIRVRVWKSKSRTGDNRAATTITATAGANLHAVNAGYTTTTQGQYTLSARVKAGTNNYACLLISCFGGDGYAVAAFNLSTGALIRSGTAGTASWVVNAYDMFPMGGGWYTIQLTATLSSATGGGLGCYCGLADSGGNESWTAAGTEAISATGLQLEMASTASPYEVSLPSAAGSTNLVSNSEDLADATYYTTTGATVTANVADPFASVAVTVSETATTAAHCIAQFVSTIASNQQLTAAAYMKAGSSNFGILIIEANDGSSDCYASFNLSTGALIATGTSGTGTVASTSITAVGNGWYRCSITGTPTTNSGVTPTLYAGLTDASGNIAYAGNTSKNILIGYAQLTPGALVAYTPTYATALSTNKILFSDFPSFSSYWSYTGVTVAAVTNNDPFYIANELTAATQTGTTITNLLTSAEQVSTVTWAPGATITLTKEYLFFQTAWEITTASGASTADVVLRRNSTSLITTPDFSAGTGVSVSLTGLSIAAAQGALGVSTSKPLSGQALAASQATLTVSVTSSLGGISIASAQGALGVSTAKALSGSALAAAQGALVPGMSLPLTGQGLASAAGTLSAAISSVPLVGSAAPSAAGTLTANLTLALAGSSMTTGTGTVTPVSGVFIPLTGQAATSATGSMTVAARSVTLTGLAQTVAQGTLTPVVGQGAQLAGQQAVVSAGTLVPTVSIALTGISATASMGAIGSARTNPLAGLLAGTGAGQLAPSSALSLHGAAAQAQLGTLLFHILLAAKYRAYVPAYAQLATVPQLDNLATVPAYDNLATVPALDDVATET